MTHRSDTYRILERTQMKKTMSLYMWTGDMYRQLGSKVTFCCVVAGRLMSWAFVTGLDGCFRCTEGPRYVAKPSGLDIPVWMNTAVCLHESSGLILLVVLNCVHLLKSPCCSSSICQLQELLTAPATSERVKANSLRHTVEKWRREFFTYCDQSDNGINHFGYSCSKVREISVSHGSAHLLACYFGDDQQWCRQKTV